jgi:predicted transcriptional regulator of viral defense system
VKLNELRRIQKLYFGCDELARALGITHDSARVAASRYVRQGLLVRVRRNLYVLRETWEACGREEKFIIANMGQVPSYISLTTALDYYGITTQMQQDFFESVTLFRTKTIQVHRTVFTYTKMAEPLYSGFIKERGFFIATPEKALLDALYLMSYGRYRADLSAIDASRLDLSKLKALSDEFPVKTRKFLQKNWGQPPIFNA